MIPDKSWTESEVQARYSGYHRTFGRVSCILVGLVLIYLGCFPLPALEEYALFSCCALLLAYYWGTGRLRITPDNGRARTLQDLFLLLLFVSVTSFFTGQTHSPFYHLSYLIVMAGALTQPQRFSYLLAASTLSSCAVLVATEDGATLPALARHLPEFISLALVAHLGALLGGAAARARREAERLALTDDLTALHNMRSFHALAQQQEKMAKRYSKPFAVCMIDTDNLKQVNDRFGHLAGTELIKWTARIIEENIRECDVAARFGGDEFIILYSEHDKRQIFPAVERIVEAIAATPFLYDGHEMTCTVSAGVASFPEDGGNLEEVMAYADLALYQSKDRGKNRALMYGDRNLAPLAARRAGVVAVPAAAEDAATAVPAP